MSTGDFLVASDHYERLVQTLAPKDLSLYRRMRHVRSEAAFRNRSFVIYEIRDREPVELDNVVVLDYHCTDEKGSTTELRSTKLEESVIVGYKPVQLFHYPVFVHLPLHGKVRWSTTADNIEGGSLAFDIAIRTLSRLHMRERGVVYCETGVNYAREFEGAGE